MILNLTNSYYGRTSTVILAILIMVKVAVSAWNFSTYPISQQYDNSMHVARIGTCGLYTTERFYNQPLYYMLSCPFVFISLLGHVDIYADVITPLRQGETLDQIASRVRGAIKGTEIVSELAIPILQIMNIILLTIVYYLWSFHMFPRLLYRNEQALAASLLLLALPGFQKLAAMTHPDNLLVFMATVVFWFWMNVGSNPTVLARRLPIFGILVGLMALTRPFALAPVACFAVLGPLRVLLSASEKKLSWQLKRSIRPIAVFTTIVILMGGSWWGYRFAVTGNAFSSMESDSEYIEAYRQRTSQLGLDDYVKFYTSFHPVSLFKEPSRYISADGEAEKVWKSSKNNSFFTLLFSDFWGDHWLYFSGERYNDNKKVFKRILLVIAFFLAPFMGVAYFHGAWRILRGVRTDVHSDCWLAALALTVVGGALFILWQGTSGFEPGKHSSVKFIYIAYLVPFAIAVMARSAVVEHAPPWALRSALGILFVVALPLSLYWE